jgi:hypothetical protein
MFSLLAFNLNNNNFYVYRLTPLPDANDIRWVKEGFFDGGEP